jgi:hypothetical protein
MPVRTRFVASLLFGSGFCALIYQTTWLREFRLIFGASTAASAAVIGVFMAGLGFGGIILGRRSETKARPLEFYARLELLIAASAALSPLLIWAARHLYIAIEAFEPHILWQKKFLEVRKACYSSLQNPRAAQASRDLDDFMRQEASTADVVALTEEIEQGSGSKNHASSQAEGTDFRP